VLPSGFEPESQAWKA